MEATIKIKDLELIFHAIREKKPGLQILTVVAMRISQGNSIEEILEMLHRWHPAECEFDHIVDVIEHQNEKN